MDSFHFNKESKKESKKEKIYEILLKNPHMIEHITQTADYCMLALVLDHTCIDKIKKPTWVMKKFVTERINIENKLCKNGESIIFEF